jgi:hypothetical protein
MAGVPDVAELMQRTAIEASPDLPRALQTARGLRHPRRTEALRRDGRTVGRLGARGSGCDHGPARPRLRSHHRPPDMGPMQFLPDTWARYASDGKGDGVADPQNLYDSTLAAARYLCSADHDLRDPTQAVTAILRYNNSMSYAHNVLGWPRPTQGPRYRATQSRSRSPRGLSCHPWHACGQSAILR